MAKYAVGQLVVCVRVNNPKYAAMVGAVGSIMAVEPYKENPIAALLGLSFDYVVDFPSLRQMICPCCNKLHSPDGGWGMDENELKPLEDPDAEEETPRVEELNTPSFGMN